MMNYLDELSLDERLIYVLNGTDFAYFVACNDAKDYNLFRYDDTAVDESRVESMRTLSLLDRLGYPMDELGTYLYKELILKIITRIRNVKEYDDIQECKSFLLKLKDEYSDVYHSLAREELELGVKSFHEYIKRALSMIDYSSMDKDLIKDIYSRVGYDITYGENAFVLASYLLGKLKINKTNESNDVPRIRHLTNTRG